MEKPLNKMYDSIKTAQSPQFFSQLTGGSNVNTSSGWTRRLVKPWGLLLSLTGKGEMELDGESLKIPEGSLLVYKPGYRYLPAPWGNGIISGFTTRSGIT